MAGSCIGILFFLAVLQVAVQGCSIFANTDVVDANRVSGSSGEIFNVASDAECCSSCRSNTECVAWVRQPSTNTCWLLASYEGTAPTADRNVGVPSGGTYYYVVSPPGNYASVRQYCQTLNGDLASITSSSANAAVQAACHQTRCYIGLVNITTAWTWNDGAAFNYTNWALNQGTDLDGTRGVISSSTGQWDDLPASTVAAGVCVIPEPTRVFHVVAGASTEEADENGNYPWHSNEFFPDAMTIDVGDLVIFHFKSHKLATVTWHGNTADVATFRTYLTSGARSPTTTPFFDAAVVGYPTTRTAVPVRTHLTYYTSSNPWSGISSGARNNLMPDYEVRFVYPGTYVFYDILSLEKITITVQNRFDSVLPKTPAEVEMASWAGINAFRQAVADVEEHQYLKLGKYADVRINSDGSQVHTVWAGYGITDSIAKHRFLPSTVTIREGDTVEWIPNDEENHVVAFYGRDSYPVFPATWVSDSENGLGLNPYYLFRSRQDEYDGEGGRVSGLLRKAGIPEPLNGNNGFTRYNSYSLKFTEAGVYYYIDPLSSYLETKGLVVVLEKEEYEHLKALQTLAIKSSNYDALSDSDEQPSVAFSWYPAIVNPADVHEDSSSDVDHSSFWRQKIEGFVPLYDLRYLHEAHENY